MANATADAAAAAVAALSSTAAALLESGSSASSSSAAASYSSSSTGGDDRPDEAAIEAFIATNTFLAAAVLVLCMIAAHTVKKRRWYWLPESVVSIAIGSGFGGLILAFRPKEVDNLFFDPRIFFFILLPPIIFNAGYNMKRKNFFKYFGAIMLFAILGTMVAIAAIAFALFYISQNMWAGYLPRLTLVESFIFATLISNIDPVATLSILGAIDANQMLYSIVFGESMLNDAVSVVLFHTLTNLGDAGLQADPVSIVKLCGLFVGEACGSVAFGIAVGLLASFVFRVSTLHEHPPIETTLLLLFAYISYAVPEILGLSGIMSLFFCGIILAHYNWYNLSEASRATTRHGLESGSFLAETALFVYLGLNFTFSFGHISENLAWNPTFLGVALTLCFASRAAGVFLLSIPFNLLSSSSRRIPLKMQVVIWWSGLRGSVSFALALNTPGPTNPIIVTTTLAIILFTTIVCGGLTERVVRACDMKKKNKSTSAAGGAADANGGGDGGDAGDDADGGGGGPKRGLDESLLGEDLVAHLSGEGERLRWTDHGRSLMARWKRFDQHFMKRWFGGKSRDRVYISTAQAEAELGLGSPSAAGPHASKAEQVAALTVSAEGMHVGSMPAMAMSPLDSPVGAGTSSPSPPGPSSFLKRSGSGSPRSSYSQQQQHQGGANSPLVSRGNRMPKYGGGGGAGGGGTQRSASPASASASASSTGSASASSNSQTGRKGRDRG